MDTIYIILYVILFYILQVENIVETKNNFWLSVFREWLQGWSAQQSFSLVSHDFLKL